MDVDRRESLWLFLPLRTHIDVSSKIIHFLNICHANLLTLVALSKIRMFIGKKRIKSSEECHFLLAYWFSSLLCEDDKILCSPAR